MNNHSCCPRRASQPTSLNDTIKMNGLDSVVCNRMGAMRSCSLQHYYYVQPNSSLSKVRAFDE
jgi:hypothetical protein